MENKNKTSIISVILKILYYIVILFLCLIGIFLLYYIISSQVNKDNPDYKPNISLYTIVSPSMTPNINVYDVVVNKRIDNPKDIKIGDIITYISASPTSEGMTITHRVIEVSKLPDGTYEYLTQGDNNSEPDSLYVLYNQVIGKEIIIIPYLGKVQFLVANQKGWLFLLLIPIAFFIFKDFYKLIELYGLRKKVDKVSGVVEKSTVQVKREEEEIRKEKIKAAIEKKKVIKQAVIRSENETAGFLNEYKETIVTVNKNRYYKEEIEEETFEPSLDLETIKQDLKPIKKQPEVVNEQYEILDTDELTTKIKEYDTKIQKLDKMLEDIENTKSIQKVEEEIEEDDYLLGSKIKVLSVETVKDAKRPKKKTESKKEILEKEERIKKIEETIELKSLIPIAKSLETTNFKKMERPKNSIDIKEVRKKEIDSKENKSPKKTKRDLDLNPKEIKKINRPNKKTNKKIEEELPRLKLNPNDVKQINRVKVKKTPPKKEMPKLKEKLIIIEKIK